jgi:anti-anti-sigma regulatory factor
MCIAFRITKEITESGITLRIDEELTYKGLSEFGKAYEGIMQPLTIDLSGLRFADELVIKLLKQMAQDGCLYRHRYRPCWYPDCL